MPIEFLSIKRARFDDENTTFDYNFKGSNPRAAEYWISRSIAERVIACWDLMDEYDAMQARIRDTVSCAGTIRQVMTYFEVFSLPPKLQIDTAALEKSFYKLSREFHPDRFASKPADEQSAATEKSSLLNDAYRALRDPIRRTEYLLELEGVELEEQSVKATESARASGTQKKQIVPPDLLEEAFELNMQLEEMKMAKQVGDDDPQLRKDLEAAKVNFTGMLDASRRELEALWTSWDAAVDSGDDGAKDAAKDEMVALLNRRSYLRNLVRDVNAALE